MIEINNTTRTELPLKALELAAERVMSAYGVKNKNLSLALVGERSMRKLNFLYRGFDRPTDVLSFEGEGEDLGEVVLCYARIKLQAVRFGHTPRQELLFILIHGLLHLFGQNDEAEEERLAMVAEGERLIRQLKIK
jgi:probable rRNA maturation factor